MDIHLHIDDHTLGRAKRWTTGLGALALAGALVLPLKGFAEGSACEALPFGLCGFIAGERISVDDVNDNFAALGEHAEAFEGAMSVADSGHVGMGTTTPRGVLHLDGEGGPISDGNQILRISSMEEQLDIGVDSDANMAWIRGTAHAQRFDLGLIPNGYGKVFVGNPFYTPTHKLHVDGDLRVTDLAGAGSGYVCVDADGGLYRSEIPCA